MAFVSRDIVVSNKLGLHARPAMQFVDLANQFSSVITVRKAAIPPGPDPAEQPGEDAVDADGKSVMQMIILAATEGTTLKIEAEGDDAERAVRELADLFNSKFGEE